MGEVIHPSFSAPKRVQLAREASFTLGRLGVHPATRQINCGAERETVEPRVMQVLVALARADGEVVSKDELLDCCWDGRVVGEDAVNRVISRLRHIAATLGGNTFQVDTIRSVGYRLIESGPALERPEVPSLETDGGLRPISRRVAIGATVAVAGVAAAGVWLRQPPKRRRPSLAVQYYQRGLETRGQNSLELTERGTALFRQATRIDPEFADAWGALAWNYRGMLEYGPRPDSARLHVLSQSAAARALELDARNVEAHAALLLLNPFYRNWAAVEEGCKRLLKEHPRNSNLEFNLGRTLIQVGRTRESIQYFRAVSERETFWPLAHLELTRALYSSGRVEEAEDHVEDGMKRFPRNTDYWVSKVRNLTISGRLEEALAFASDLTNRPAERSVVQPDVEFEMSLIRALTDGSAQARHAMLQKVSEDARRFPGLLGLAAVTAPMLGLPDASFSMLEGGFFGEGPWAFGRWQRPQTGLLFTGSTAPLRRDARFLLLLRKIGLEDYWRTTGTIPDYRRFPEPQYRLPIG